MAKKKKKVEENFLVENKVLETAVEKDLNETVLEDKVLEEVFVEEKILKLIPTQNFRVGEGYKKVEIKNLSGGDVLLADKTLYVGDIYEILNPEGMTLKTKSYPTVRLRFYN